MSSSSAFFLVYSLACYSVGKKENRSELLGDFLLDCSLGRIAEKERRGGLEERGRRGGRLFHMPGKGEKRYPTDLSEDEAKYGLEEEENKRAVTCRASTSGTTEDERRKISPKICLSRLSF